MKYKIIAIVLLLCVLAGCKVELPEQAVSGSISMNSTGSEVSSREADSAALVPSSQSAPEQSQVSPSSAPQSNSSKQEPPTPAVSKAPAPKESAAPSSPEIKQQTCTLSISCADILSKKDRFTEEQLSTVPKDGVILSTQKVIINEGETVYDVLLRETKQRKIPMDHINSPAFQTEYIRGIDNIYENGFGAGSGWMYAVNGKQPAVGCSSYRLKSGDSVQFIYVCGK
jgi:hypothetical protein